MKPPVLMQQSKIAIAEIDDRRRLRPVSAAGVQSLLASIAETGVMKDAIHVRKKKEGSLVLLAGAHRLEAARQLGWVEIEAKVWTDVTDDWAALIEIDDNLAGSEMNALDTAVFLAARKAVYERLHPETKRGIAGAAARWDDASELGSFASVTAEKFGMSMRQIQKIIAAGARLAPDQVNALRTAPKPVTLKDLSDLSKISNSSDRYSVVDRLASGTARSAADALRAIRAADNAGSTAVKDPIDDQFTSLMKSFARAGAAARQRFASERFDELVLLIGAVEVDRK